ncbi:hypothetical protein BV22DRAFT_40162 [Leucogyrophana mollusca]|uniref:Uncharacterized protein n=1 Tax=Leucogyrophana mollusca TaxID=85980 RepID=A0ACB8BYW6_9AGAM|nr:hypothetical protein BV22DRAFT_40162 [Leucogyrophana mollusca]
MYHVNSGNPHKFAMLARDHGQCCMATDESLSEDAPQRDQNDMRSALRRDKCVGRPEQSDVYNKWFGQHFQPLCSDGAMEEGETYVCAKQGPCSWGLRFSRQNMLGSSLGLESSGC